MNGRISEIKDDSNLDELFKESRKSPVLLFKHSSACSISHSVFSSVKNLDADIFMVTVQTGRQISNSIAARTGIRHESPQAIVIDEGKPVYSASHFDIDAGEISALLASGNLND